MGWKDWPYWLKGGIIVGFLDLIFVSWILSGHPDQTILLGVTHPILFWFGRLNELNPFLQDLLIGIQAVVFYFLVGALIGWIYGLVKERKR